MRVRKATETDLVRACLQLLTLRGIPAWRNNVGVAMLPGKGGKPRPVRFGTVGAADILGLLPGSGRMLAVECKMPAGRLSDAQKAFLDTITRSGGLALVIRDVADLASELERRLKP